jgi:alkylation response protein AidB-like acyl-CoA dehydrogenase
MILEPTDAQQAFRASVADFASTVVVPRAAAIDETGAFPSDVLHAAAERRLLGITVPQTWGGLGLDYMSYALAIERSPASARP